jgi:hypothetical protein
VHRYYDCSARYYLFPLPEIDLEITRLLLTGRFKAVWCYALLTKYLISYKDTCNTQARQVVHQQGGMIGWLK